MNTDLGSIDFSMVNQTTYSTDPLLEYMFDTAAEAVNQAKIWGFDGYRAYLVNGTIKYIPCTTAAEYQQATQLTIHQGDIVAQGKEVFGDKLVGYQFAQTDAVTGDPIFTLGNFTITTSINQKQDAIFTLADSKKGYVGLDFTVDGIEALKAQVTQNVTAKVRFDKSNLEKYVTYASLSERFRVTLQEIAETFPASMHVVPYFITQTSVFEYFTDANGTSATFKVLIADINNPYTIDFYKTGLTATQSEYVSPLRNFSKNYRQYEVYYNGVAYPILGVVLPKTTNDSNGLVLSVQGDPFASVVSVNRTANVNFYIKPIKKAWDDFYTTTSDLTAFLLNPKSNPLYVAVFNVPHRSDDGEFQIVPQTMSFPMYDDYNVDIFNDPFDKYTTDLQFIADEFDRFKTDLISRFLTAESLQEFDTPDRKTYVTWQAYGAMFDNVKKYADGISYMTKVSYDKIDNVPDVLLKNFAHMLGWKTYEIEQDDTLIESLFDVSVDRQGDDTPAEIDIELWRRIIINSFYLFKSKGTRKSIEFALELVGIPLEIMDINEYVYVADHQLPYSDFYNVFNQSISDYPIDTDGYPTTPPYTYFQADGGSMLNNAQNIGDYDNGKTYLDTFRKFGSVKAFDLNRTIDNKKSWVVATGETQQSYDFLLRDTNYTIKDSRLVINSKEADAAISSQMTFDYYVYSFYNKNGYDISTSTATVEPSTLTFNDYIREITSKLVDPKNRKVIKIYPVLSKIYWDYLDYAGALDLKTIDYVKTLDFMSKFDTYWVKLLQQFIPATTIFLAGRKFANANVTKSKFQYKHGLRSSTGWTGTDGSEFQDEALKPSPSGYLDVFHCDGVLSPDLHGNNIIFLTEAKLSEKAHSYLTRGGYFDADSYDFYRHYASQQNVLQLQHGNFGSMTGLTLNTGLTTCAGAASLYFYAKNGSTGTIKLGHKVSLSGSTFDENLGLGTYAGLSISGTTGSTVLSVDAMPVSGSTLYPLQLAFFSGLHNVTVDPNEYYIVEGDILLDFQVTGRSSYSYLSLICTYDPNIISSISPSNIISNLDMMEGCFGSGEYEKLNWVHLKTKFKCAKSIAHIHLVGKDIDYSGSGGTIRMKNFTVKKVSSNINFITPPPLPHVCYYDYDGYRAPLLTGMIINPEFLFATTSWIVPLSPSEIDFSLTEDLATATFDYTVNNGVRLFSMRNQTYTTTPEKDNLYYCSFDIDIVYTGSTIIYSQMPTIYVHPFNNDPTNEPLSAYPFKFKGDLNHKQTKFEGYYYPTTISASTITVVAIQNETPITTDYTVNFSNFVLAKVDAYYVSDSGVLFWYKQPHAFGYSKNTNVTAPDYAVGGTSTAWIIPFIPTGMTGQTGDVSGMYEQYVSNRSGITTGMTAPLMHVNTTYVDKFNLDATNTTIDINLTQTCGLGYQFYLTGSTIPTLCVTPRGSTIENQLFMSGALDFQFDGFYPLTGSTQAGLGPFYSSKTVYGIYGNVGTDDVPCPKNINTRLPIINSYGNNWEYLRTDTGYTATHHHIPADFQTELPTVSLANRTNNNYLVVNRYNLIKVEASIIYDSTIDTEQSVLVKLMGANGFVYNQKSYIVGGSANPTYATVQSRTLDYTFEGFYYINDEIYLTVQPQSFNCVFKKEEAIDCVGGYILSGSTSSRYSHFKADKIWDSMINSGAGAWVYTKFTGDTYQYMINSVYDTIRFTPTGVSGHTLAPTEVYDFEHEYYMAFVSGKTANVSGRTISLMSNAIDRSQFYNSNAFLYGVYQLPPPFTGVTWTGYTENGDPVPDQSNALTGTTYSVMRKSYVKVYESDVTGIDSELERLLVAFYKKDGYLSFRNGYNKYFFDDSINRFYTATDATTREVFAYGSATAQYESDGIHLKYDFAKDLAGYPITGEFVGRLTAKDPCGNFVTIYVLLCMDVKSTASVVRVNAASLAQTQTAIATQTV
jgi:hypothetical protein